MSTVWSNVNVELYCHDQSGCSVNQMFIVDCWHWCDFFPGPFSHVALNHLHLGVYYIHSMIVWCSLVFEVIPFSDDSSKTGPFCVSPVAYLNSPFSYCV